MTRDVWEPGIVYVVHKTATERYAGRRITWCFCHVCCLYNVPYNLNTNLLVSALWINYNYFTEPYSRTDPHKLTNLRAHQLKQRGLVSFWACRIGEIPQKNHSRPAMRISNQTKNIESLFSGQRVREREKGKIPTAHQTNSRRGIEWRFSFRSGTSSIAASIDILLWWPIYKSRLLKICRWLIWNHGRSTVQECTVWDAFRVQNGLLRYYQPLRIALKKLETVYLYRVLTES